MTPLSAAAPGTGPAVVAAELLGRVRAELPVIGELGEREQLVVAAWLTGLRSARTPRAYAGDVAAWLGWLAPATLARAEGPGPGDRAALPGRRPGANAGCP